jgi:hypothetical protein
VALLARRRWLRSTSLALYVRRSMEYGALRVVTRARRTVPADGRVLDAMLAQSRSRWAW